MLRNEQKIHLNENEKRFNSELKENEHCIFDENEDNCELDRNEDDNKGITGNNEEENVDDEEMVERIDEMNNEERKETPPIDSMEEEEEEEDIQNKQQTLETNVLQLIRDRFQLLSSSFASSINHLEIKVDKMETLLKLFLKRSNDSLDKENLFCQCSCHMDEKDKKRKFPKDHNDLHHDIGLNGMELNGMFNNKISNLNTLLPSHNNNNHNNNDNNNNNNNKDNYQQNPVNYDNENQHQNNNSNNSKNNNNNNNSNNNNNNNEDKLDNNEFNLSKFLSILKQQQQQQLNDQHNISSTTTTTSSSVPSSNTTSNTTSINNVSDEGNNMQFSQILSHFNELNNNFNCNESSELLQHSNFRTMLQQLLTNQYSYFQQSAPIAVTDNYRQNNHLNNKKKSLNEKNEDPSRFTTFYKNWLQRISEAKQNLQNNSTPTSINTQKTISALTNDFGNTSTNGNNLNFTSNFNNSPSNILRKAQTSPTSSINLSDSNSIKTDKSSTINNDQNNINFNNSLFQQDNLQNFLIQTNLLSNSETNNETRSSDHESNHNFLPMLKTLLQTINNTQKKIIRDVDDMPKDYPPFSNNILPNPLNKATKKSLLDSMKHSETNGKKMKFEDQEQNSFEKDYHSVYYNGDDLMQIVSWSGKQQLNRYARSILTRLFTRDEMAYGIMPGTDGTERFSRFKTLDSSKIQLLKDCLRQRLGSVDYEKLWPSVRDSCNSKCRELRKRMNDKLENSTNAGTPSIMNETNSR
ncbi:hypothetical protein SNEBB_005959 [Seison nebaliae]|nr:hypothetical protein SNEBB_005959 [Seison nebaliae]